jgi:NAD(P)-dependent dehydrogenase (short-subunit alcohol dehydrogenase family)
MSDTRLVIITGASKGLGLVLTRTFAANGWKAVGTGRSEQPSDWPEGAVYRQFDASNAVECESFWEQVHKEYTDAQVCLVNNAGSYVGGGLLDAKPTDFEQQMQGVYFTSVHMTQAMAKQVATARIINIVSSTALQHDPEVLAYGAAKAAQWHFFKTLQEEFQPDKYRITNLYPSYIATHGPNPDAIDPGDLATFVLQQAELEGTYYLKDVTLYPS